MVKYMVHYVGLGDGLVGAVEVEHIDEDEMAKL
jgi:hypothetical protein